MKLRANKVLGQSAKNPLAERFWHPAIEMRPVKKLRPSERNARTHSKRQREKLIAAVRRFGFINPIIIDEEGHILAGHLRYEVACELGLKLVPAIEITHLTELEKRAFALAENRIALDAGWDRETLAAELGELAVLLPEAQIDFATTGFDIAEADIIIGDQAEPPENYDDDDAPEPGPLVTRLNDRWNLAKAPSYLRRRPGSCMLRSSHARRHRNDGIHRSPLQRFDENPCTRQCAHLIWGIRDGVG
jgi:hypothetical protein